MPSPSQTRICNAALAHLGESARITSIDDGTPLAKMLLAVWDEARDEVQADHPWNCCVHRASLPVSADYTPAGEQYAQAFELPGDCLRWLPHAKDHPDYFEGEQEGDYILSDAAAPIAVRYIRRIEDVSAWSPGLCAAMSAKLAWKLAEPLTGQAGKEGRMADKYDEALRKGKRQDGAATGDRARRIEYRSNWLQARRQAPIIR